eukprot:1189928-Pleurochrysis_carterae.AAC.1
MHAQNGCHCVRKARGSCSKSAKQLESGQNCPPENFLLRQRRPSGRRIANASSPPQPMLTAATARAQRVTWPLRDACAEARTLTNT